MRADERDDRLGARKGVLLQARYRKSSWHVLAVELGDVSCGGCSMVCNPEAFHIGETVRLSFAHLKPLEAEVRWLADGKVGVEFRAVLQGRTLEDLAKTYGIAVAPDPRVTP